MISTERRLLYLHVPRTAGTSIGLALAPYFDETQPPGSTHWSIEQWRDAYDLTGYLVFISIRNPWDQVASLHEYRLQRGIETTIDLDAVVCQTPRQTGLAHADMTIRFESLEKDFRAICRAARLPKIELPFVNWRKRAMDDYREYHTDFSQRVIGNRFSLCIERFGYSF